MTTSAIAASKPTSPEVAAPIQIERRLPPHELNGRRRRKRNLTRLPGLKPAAAPTPAEGVVHV